MQANPYIPVPAKLVDVVEETHNIKTFVVEPAQPIDATEVVQPPVSEPDPSPQAALVSPASQPASPGNGKWSRSLTDALGLAPPSDEPGASSRRRSSSLSESFTTRSAAESSRGSSIRGGIGTPSPPARNGPPSSSAKRSPPCPTGVLRKAGPPFAASGEDATRKGISTCKRRWISAGGRTPKRKSWT